MAKALNTDDPHLLGAVNRLGQALKVWGGIFIAFGFLTYLVNGARHPLTGLSWIVIGGLCFLGPQPLMLMPVAAQMAFSLLLPLARISLLYGPDPLTEIMGAGGVELAGMLLVRGIMLFAAANQFFFYRLLYGTTTGTGLDPDLPAIPEMVTNRADSYAALARAFGIASLISLSAALALGRTGYYPLALELAGVCGILGVGLGAGVALSPTQRRATALFGAIAGLVGYLAAPSVLALLLNQ